MSNYASNISSQGAPAHFASGLSSAPHSYHALNRQHFANVPLNNDPNPYVIHKKSAPITYRQDIAVRFIKPPPLPPHGDIVVKQMPDTQAPPAPPVHYRHQPPQPVQPPPQIIREQPPVPPPQLPAEVHTIPGRVYRAPRQVIREDYAVMPPKPPSIIVERWLPYPEQVREVVYEPAPPPIHMQAPAAFGHFPGRAFGGFHHFPGRVAPHFAQFQGHHFPGNFPGNFNGSFNGSFHGGFNQHAGSAAYPPF